jgi:DNA-binding transcriptional LysR family regulator
MRSLTLKQLRALAAVVRTGSVTGAARELAVTPPAVTAQVQLLERLAGLPVVERTGQSIRPTAAGRELLAATARVETALADCEAALRALKGQDAGSVSVGVISTAKYFAPLALGAFARANPGIELKLVVGNRAEIVAGLADFSLDVAVMGRPPENLDVEALAIGDHPHVVIAAPDHALVARRGIPVAALAHESFLSREEGSGTRALTERLFEEMGVRPRIALVIGSNETIKQAVIAGLGVSVISAHTVGAEVADGRLAVLDIEGMPIVRQWYVVTMRDKRLLPAATGLHAFLRAEVRRFLPALGSGTGERMAAAQRGPRNVITT